MTKFIVLVNLWRLHNKAPDVDWKQEALSPKNVPIWAVFVAQFVEKVLTTPVANLINILRS